MLEQNNIKVFDNLSWYECNKCNFLLFLTLFLTSFYLIKKNYEKNNSDYISLNDEMKKTKNIQIFN